MAVPNILPNYFANSLNDLTPQHLGGKSLIDNPIGAYGGKPGKNQATNFYNNLFGVPKNPKVRDKLYYKLYQNYLMAQNTPDLYPAHYIDAYSKGIRKQGLQQLANLNEKTLAAKNAQGMLDSGVSKYLIDQQKAATHQGLQNAISNAQNKMLQANYDYRQQQIENALNFLDIFRKLKQQRRLDILNEILAAEAMQRQKKASRLGTLVGLGQLAAGIAAGPIGSAIAGAFGKAATGK